MQNIRFKALVTEAENHNAVLTDIFEFTDLAVGGAPLSDNVNPVYPRVAATVIAGVAANLAALSKKLLEEAE